MIPESELLPYARRSDFKVARANELTGADRRLYRCLEILPGLLAWVFLVGVVLASIYASFWAAYFVIAFAIYWVLKTIFLSYHVRYNWRRLRHHMNLDWGELVSRFTYDQYYHLLVFPYYKEPEEVLEGSMAALAKVNYDPKKLIVVLAAEERAGAEAIALGKKIEDKWAATFGHFIVTTHPSDTRVRLPVRVQMCTTRCMRFVLRCLMRRQFHTSMSSPQFLILILESIPTISTAWSGTS